MCTSMPIIKHKRCSIGTLIVIELTNLRGFVEVVEQRRLQSGRKRLGISKSIVSRRIARLEADLGARLLSRTTRRYQPAEAGLEFKARSERILAELGRRERQSPSGGEVVGRLRLSAHCPLVSAT